MPVYLSIKKPMEYEGFESLMEDYAEWSPDGVKKTKAAFRDHLEQQGYDGIVIRNSDTDGSVDRDDWVAFHPNQIKSALGNSGKFDPKQSDITKSALQSIAVKKIDMSAEEIGAALSAAVMNNTTMLADVASNVATSRLASYGFLAEAQYDSVGGYQISAILDDRTCPVCLTMDGTVFDGGVGLALTRLERSLATDDPNDLKLLAPWPNQDKESVKELNDSTPDDLHDLGYDAPPFHPYCRCILVPIGDAEASYTTTPEALDTSEVLPEESDSDITSMLARIGRAGRAARIAVAGEAATDVLTAGEQALIAGTPVEDAVAAGRKLTLAEWDALPETVQDIVRLLDLEPDGS
jgi:hypothetical protein